jgi:hypothetical protein
MTRITKCRMPVVAGFDALTLARCNTVLMRWLTAFREPVAVRAEL